MTMRYFEIRAPRKDFTGRIGGLSFADGAARVQFDDTRDENGMAAAEELQVNPGRSLVLFANRNSAKGYTVTELGADGKPLAEAAADEPDAGAEPVTPTVTKTTTTKGAAK